MPTRYLDSNLVKVKVYDQCDELHTKIKVDDIFEKQKFT